MTKHTPVEVLDSRAILDLDLDGIKLIEASAGTGKTHTIADLYLRHVLAGRLTSQILIVTFTNAATEELRGRIQSRLYQALTLLAGDQVENDEFLELLKQRWLDLDDDSRQQQLGRLQLALRSLDEASISTIHSFCQRSLQEHALASGQYFDSELVSDDDAIWEAAIKDWWRVLCYGLDRDSWLMLQRELGSVEQLTKALLGLRNRSSARLLPEAARDLTDLLQRPRLLAEELHGLGPKWVQHRKELAEILTESKALSRSNKLPYHAQKIGELLQAADEFFGAASAGALFDNFQYLGSEWLHDNSTKSQRGKDARLDHEFFTAVGAIARQWQEFRRALGPQLRIDALRKASRQVMREKQEQAVLAYQDQLNLLLQALQSDSGQSMARALRRQYPVAMIDEFQDTDNIQYRIFEHIYPAGEEVSLTLIGDPKQAIYSFRGGDIFTYMHARRLPTIRHYDLTTNWRSQPGLVAAVNTLFNRRPDAFVYRDSIEFHPVTAIEKNDRFRLRGAASEASMILWQLPQTEAGENYNREQMRDRINLAIAAEISTLLDQSGAGPASLDGKPVQSGDIAVLVRNAAEGQELSRILHAHGIRTVTIGRDSVFKSDEANGLYDLLLAIARYQDSAVATRSLASNLLQLDYREIAEIVDNDASWQRWLEDLAELQQLWQRQGFIAMFQSLLHCFDISLRLAQRDNSERRLTNLLHLAELLQQQSRQISGIAPLLAWLRQQFDENAGEEAELRLEDDEALVKIVTIHKSKGLQYPIVFVPYLWSCKQVPRQSAISFHDNELAACIDLGSDRYEEHWFIAEKERLAEDLRLLYVAVTRARSRVYLAWGKAGAEKYPGYASRTALAYLLHSRQTAEDLDSTEANGFADDMDFDADIDALLDSSGGNIERVVLPEASPPITGRRDDGADVTPLLANFARKPATQWRVNSFTALTRGVHQPAHRGASGASDDPILDFPAGSHVGLLLHSMLENLDFQGDIEAQCGPLFDRFLAQAGLADEHRPDLVRWLENIMQTPLDGAALSLDRIGRQQRLDELEFDFALDLLDVDTLNDFMQERVDAPLQPLSSADFRGMINGVIDLVFEYEGRFYLADYKSNYLGSAMQDYAPERLRQAMLDRRYDLQSLLYSLALHRLLAMRVADYAYERHFGGCYYLFLRALRAPQGNRYGVHFERPGQDIIERFDALFAYTPKQVSGL